MGSGLVLWYPSDAVYGEAMTRRHNRTSHRRRRWGVQHLWDGVGGFWMTLGTAWHTSGVPIPSYVDFYPMTFGTRREAQEQAKALSQRHHAHSPRWRFRTVRLEIQIHESVVKR